MFNNRSVSFANPASGGSTGVNAGGLPNQAADQAIQAAAAAAAAANVAAANVPAVSTAVTWKNLVKLDDLPNHSIAKRLAVQHKDAAWEDIVAPFDMVYHNNSARVMHELAIAPAPKCILAANHARLVQLVYGIRFCFVVTGQGDRVLALGVERSIIARTE